VPATLYSATRARKNQAIQTLKDQQTDEHAQRGRAETIRFQSTDGARKQCHWPDLTAG
jgi:hypothetical protein